MKRVFCGSLVLATALFCAPLAMAAQNAEGNTSGPAAGTVTTPSAAVQKQASNPSGTAAGAPGVAAKPGSESGPQPKASPEQSQAGKH